MKTIWDYGVKFVYGYSQAYGSKFHTGEDWTVTDYRKDIPVTVNGVTIGIAGTTGLSTGIHTHVGKWKDGKHYPPRGKGKTLGSDAVVTQIDTAGKTDNGRFVRVRSQGYDWLYLHLDSVKVKVGDKLKGEDIVKPTEGHIINMFREYARYTPTEAQIKYYMARDKRVLYRNLLNATDRSRAGKEEEISKLKETLNNFKQKMVDWVNKFKGE